MFTGAMVALITPFQNGEIDWQTLDELIDFQLENGIDGIVPVGTTGESPTLSHDEHKKVIARVVKAVGGKVPVIVGFGVLVLVHNGTEDSVAVGVLNGTTVSLGASVSAGQQQSTLTSQIQCTSHGAGQSIS